MPNVQIQISEEILESLEETPDSIGRSLRLLAAAKLVELGRLSTGRAADLAGMGRVEFLLALRGLAVSPGQLGLDDVLDDASRS